MWATRRKISENAKTPSHRPGVRLTFRLSRSEKYMASVAAEAHRAQRHARHARGWIANRVTKRPAHGGRASEAETSFNWTRSAAAVAPSRGWNTAGPGRPAQRGCTFGDLDTPACRTDWTSRPGARVTPCPGTRPTDRPTAGSGACFPSCGPVSTDGRRAFVGPQGGLLPALAPSGRPEVEQPRGLGAEGQSERSEVRSAAAERP